MRSRLENAKLLGGIGGLLMISTLVPGVGLFGALAGWVLLAISVYHLSKEFDDRPMFNYLILAAVLSLLAAFVVGAGVLGALGALFSAYVPSPQGIATLVKSILLGAVVLLVAAVLSLITFLRVSGHTGQPLIKTGAWLVFIGSILPIPIVNPVLGVAGWVCIGVGFLTWETAPQSNQFE